MRLCEIGWFQSVSSPESQQMLSVGTHQWSRDPQKLVHDPSEGIPLPPCLGSNLTPHEFALTFQILSIEKFFLLHLVWKLCTLYDYLSEIQAITHQLCRSGPGLLVAMRLQGSVLEVLEQCHRSLGWLDFFSHQIIDHLGATRSISREDKP